MRHRPATTVISFTTFTTATTPPAPAAASLLALALASALALLWPAAAVAQSAVTLYGRIDLGVTKQNAGTSALSASNGRLGPDGDRWDLRHGSESRLGFLGSEDLGGGLKAGFQIEHRFLADTGVADAVFWKARSYVYLDSNTLGNVYLGREYVPAFWPALKLDPWLWDTVGSPSLAHQFAGYRIDGHARANNSVGYKSVSFGGLTANAAVSAGEGTRDRSTGANVEYAAGPLYIGAAFDRQSSRLKVALAGMAYDFGFVRPRIMVTRATVAGVDATNITLAASVPVRAHRQGGAGPARPGRRQQQHHQARPRLRISAEQAHLAVLRCGLRHSAGRRQGRGADTHHGAGPGSEAQLLKSDTMTSATHTTGQAATRPLHRLLRRPLHRLLPALLLACTAFSGTLAQAFPDKPLTLYVGFSAGGAADTVARVLAEEMGKTLGQRVVVENRVGASGNLATMAVLSAPADGNSLLFAAIHLATNPALIGVRYEPLADLQMVSQVTSVPVLMFTAASSPYKTPADVVAAARKTPGGLKVGSGGIGTSSHLAAELFARGEGIPYLHVPYKGGPPANQALLGGEIDLMFDLMSGALSGFIDAGRVRPLAVMQETRITALPGVKSARELGMPASTTIRSWQGIAVRSGTAAPVLEKLHAAVVAAAQTPAVRARVAQLGSELVTSKAPADFQQHYAAELQRWAALVKAANIKAE